MGVFGTIPAPVHLTGHSPLLSLFGRPASHSIGPPLWVPGPWMLYHCFLWEAGNWMTGYLLQQHPVLEKSSFHSYPPIILHSTTPVVTLQTSGANRPHVGRSKFWLKSIFGPIQMLPSKLWGQERSWSHCTFTRALRAFWKIIIMLKGIVHPQIKILSLFTLTHVIPNLFDCTSFFCVKKLLVSLKLMSGVHIVIRPHRLLFIGENSWNILQNIFFCLLRIKKVMELHDGV